MPLEKDPSAGIIIKKAQEREMVGMVKYLLEMARFPWLAID